MRHRLYRFAFLLFALNAHAQNPTIQSPSGALEGKDMSGVHAFLGVPYAQPPVGELRWKAPQPLSPWEGTRRATEFGAQAMQLPLYGDMNFRAPSMSEDCLYLNIWKPAFGDQFPVLVYFYGGGFQAGDGSEPRYDGESMARNGIIAITVNYRLGAFGFFSHPELEKNNAGNQGLMDQQAALRWVYENISAFGGDPNAITIAGESAGSMSVSLQLASPGSKPFIARAIGESGSVLGKIFGREVVIPLKDAQAKGLEFQEKCSVNSLAELRAIPADELLKLSEGYGVSMTVDGEFMPKNPINIYERGKQAHVPLLLGWNSQEMTPLALTQGQEPTMELMIASCDQFFGEQSNDLLDAYLNTCDGQVLQAMTDLSGDLFLGYPSWIWGQLHLSANQPIYQYYYKRPRPAMRPEFGNARAGLAGGIVEGEENTPPPPPDAGAVHSAEIEYCLGNLGSNRVFDWQEDDYRISELMQQQFVNFIKTGNPNGPTVPTWNTKQSGHTMIIDRVSGQMEEYREARYELVHKALNP